MNYLIPTFMVLLAFAAAGVLGLLGAMLVLG